MATAKQSEVKWIKKGDIVNGKKATSGYLALRSAPGKAFSGTVTGVKSGTTTAKNGTATYSGGRNVAAMTARIQKRSGSSAAAGIAAPKETYKSGSQLNKNIGSSTVSSARKAAAKKDAMPRTLSRTQKLARDNVMKKTQLTSSGTESSKIQAVQRAITMKKQAIRNLTDKANKTAADSKRLTEEKAKLQQLTNTLKSL